jgi:hypothetical protein
VDSSSSPSSRQQDGDGDDAAVDAAVDTENDDGGTRDAISMNSIDSLHFTSSYLLYCKKMRSWIQCGVCLFG